MHFGPIFRALMRNKTGTLLLTIQIALTLAVLMNAIALMLRSNELISLETGVEQSNLVLFDHTAFDAAYDDVSFRKLRLEEDLLLLRQIEGVVGATASNGAPSLHSSSDGVGVPGDNERGLYNFASTFYGDETFLATIGVQLSEGRNFYPEEIAFASNGVKESVSNSVIITRSLADKLYPDGSALGQQVEVNDILKTVIGVCEPFEGTVPYFAFFGIATDSLAIYPARLDRKSIQFMVRVEDGRAAELMPLIKEQLLKADRGREIRDLQTLEAARAELTGMLNYANLVLGTISGLLVLTTGLGIFGLATFSVAKRRKQIGIRRALGASRAHIVQQFLSENLLITCSGIVLGLILGLGLNFALTTLGLARINGVAVLACIAFVSLLGVVSVLAPALAAARVSPAVATRTV
jgi:putative ABC transport system permease protein